MAKIAGRDCEPELKRSSPDQQIGKRDANTFGCILTVDATRAECDWNCYGVYWRRRDKFIEI